MTSLPAERLAPLLRSIDDREGDDREGDDREGDDRSGDPVGKRLGDRAGDPASGRFGLGALRRLRRRRGRILAVKWGFNPNSSSLGVDITFLLLGLSVITLLTPIVGFLLRFQRARSTTR